MSSGNILRRRAWRFDFCCVIYSKLFDNDNRKTYIEKYIKAIAFWKKEAIATNSILF
ncbi:MULTISPECIES: hypothetical protein [Cyanophyceae]|uniref:hypothetical protein n=1 Tax=Cyanophyceae TaxID=3028117 RepID=UPI0016880890|nr:hypothetical protein [Trichocoleus sp. FACHB-40]MBD2002911.1 hypothetical protein [Trichocoleus sp. FACHB-40]